MASVPQDGPPLIECLDVFKFYQRAGMEVVALRGLDLEVRRGEFMAIIGASGSGKSTLMNILSGLDRPSAGSVRVGDRDLGELNERDQVEYRRTEVGFIWQATSRNLLTYLTARDNIELPMAITGLPGEERRERAMELLVTVGLENKADRFPYQLSGGEQQRVALGVALANKPPLLLADEPTGELDTRTAEEVLLAMQSLCRTQGVTIVMVTHYSGVTPFVNRVVLIRDGRIAAETVLEPTFRRPGEIVQEDYVVVDRAGRLQLPRDTVEHLQLRGRARVLPQDEGALITPPRRQA